MIRFPGTSIQELNLDWVLKKVKDLTEQASADSAVIENYNSRLVTVENFMNDIDDTGYVTPADIAEDFSTSANYTPGTFVWRNGTLYQFLVFHAAGAWNASEVTTWKVGNFITNLLYRVVPYFDERFDFDPNTYVFKTASIYKLPDGYYHGQDWNSINKTLISSLSDEIASLFNGYNDLVSALGDTFNQIGNDIFNINSQIRDYNATNLISGGNRTDKTGTVTFTWNADKTVCTVNGTSTGNSVLCTFLGSSTTIPNGFVAGGTYHISCTASSSSLRLAFYYYKNGTYYNSQYTSTNRDITIPSDATGLIVLIALAPNSTVSNATIGDLWADDAYTNKQLEALINDAFNSRGILANNTNLNTVKGINGSYLLDGSATYTNCPESSAYGGVLNVYCPVATITAQYFVSNKPDGNYWYRWYVQGTDTWSSWNKISGTDVTNNYSFPTYENTYNVTATPSITTDTNNFLSATGDTTDRKADIEAMLASTKNCHLGPGNFYVSGVDIPLLGSLEGCGNATTIILLASVTDGYALNLGTYASVRNLRIIGQTTNYTPSQTVGTRHGILWAGTASEQESGTSGPYRGIIDNVTISDFSGGAITCYNTGLAWSSSVSVTNVNILRCDVGINIPYFSEFNRFTNILSGDNYYGCINNGGNNFFTNCSFSGNTVGILIDNSSNQSRNVAHGTYSACNIHHSGQNAGTALRLLNVVNGELFTGCQIGYGAIEIDDCKRVVFSGCSFGSTTPFTITDSISTLFGDCTFLETNNFTITNSASTHFNNCYDNTGVAVNPMA